MLLDNDFIITKSLGKGSYAEVFLASKIGSSELCAAKRIDRAYAEIPHNLKRLLNEVTILERIKHPNIIKLIQAKKTKSYCYIITEYINGGDIYENLNKYKFFYRMPFTEEIVQYLMRQIVDAVNYLHSNKIIHRDLKLENILLNYPTKHDKNTLNILSTKAKIIDFGFATRLRNSKSNITFSVLGSPSNMDPKLLKYFESDEYNQYGYDEKLDIWSLGALCYEMITGHMTFDGQNVDELKQNVNKGIYYLPLTLSKECISFVNAMLQYDPNKRLSAKELLNHDFLVKDLKSFHPIDINIVKNHIKGNCIYLDINNNESIWKIFNQNYEKKININIINKKEYNQFFHKKNPAQLNQIQYYHFEKINPKKNQIYSKGTNKPKNHKNRYRNKTYDRQKTYTQPHKIFPIPEEVNQNYDLQDISLKGNDLEILEQIPLEFTFK